MEDWKHLKDDDIIRGTDFYQNGKPSLVVEELKDDKLFKATSYDPKGKKIGQVKNGNGIIFTCDSLGGNCHELKFQEGKKCL